MGFSERYWNGKVAVVTGGAGGMGRELVLQLVDAGASVATCDVSLEQLNETCELASSKASASQKVTAHVVDVSDRARVLQFVDEVLQEYGKVDALFNNAGVVCAQTTFETTFEEWDRVVAINLFGVVNCTIGFLKHLTSSRQAALVNTSSLAGIVGMPGNSAYGTAKFAVRGFSEVMLAEARFVAPNLTVTVVHPGGIKTNIFQNCSQFIHDTKIEVPGGFKGLNDADGLHGMLQTLGGTTAKDAAAQIIRGVAHGQTRILVGSDVWLLDLVSRISPHFMLSGRWANLALPGLAVVSTRLIGRKVLFSLFLSAVLLVLRRRRVS